MQTRLDPDRAAPGGFTRLELLVVLLMLALLTLVARPVRGAGGSVKTAVCMENLRRLTAAWLLYAQDNNGRMAGNYSGMFVPAPGAAERPWATGWLDWTSASDNTNTVYLTDPRYAVLTTYTGRDASLYPCPGDGYVSTQQLSRGWLRRVRSYAMNCYVGEGNAANGPIDASYPIVTKLTGFGSLPPQNTFVFTEEHPDSINDPMLYTSMSAWQWIDLPAAFHEGAGSFAFADGHHEIHAWRNATTLKPVTLGTFAMVPLTPNDVDLAWVRARTAAR
ncbi:MAG TPA: prepilin-type cleavage/methylation domain-containing protein [Verrucomicrobiota bacterium]|nr:prepilin-type cleavage/methylation domain-containing protein [Verrucomicrobiota bacterium]HRZ38178.1 prepilin-type cleavage/methylation domain-containing protein [Candidatus Paceibacterota bacterium]HRZ55243.1 prepilin-type cleavage/methylation domain-containing protein [Candidatus Paceibacterota bacterium]